jgi:hypothetical protein
MKSSIIENVQQAEKLLKVHNIDLNNPDYQKFKSLLVTNNNVGYLGFITKLLLNNSNFFSYNTAEEIYKFLVDNKNVLTSLPKQLNNYESVDELKTDIASIAKRQSLKQFLDKITNKFVKEQLPNNIDEDLLNNLEYFNRLNKADQQEFLRKVNKFDDIEDFKDSLSEFVEDMKIGFKYDIVLNKINSMSKDEIKLLYSKNNIILARILKYAASKELGSKSWCIVGDENMFDSYTENGKNYQYFLFNFNPEIEPHLKMIAFTMDAENNVTASHDRYDRQFSKPINYLENIGIKSKVVEINSRERYETSLTSAVSNVLKNNNFKKNVDADNKIYNDKIFNNSVYNYEGVPAAIFLQQLNNVSSETNLDVLFDYFQNIEITVQRYRENIGTEKINVIPIALHNIYNISQINFDILKNSGVRLAINSDKIIKLLEKVYLSNIKLLPETKHAILHFLKDNDVDILKLSQRKKQNQMSDMEYGMLIKRGENLKPLIQNKLAAIRRGENVSLTSSEVKYAIDNGFEGIIKKYYTNMLPYFMENQLDYDDMNIYKKLNMLDKISDVIYKKGNMYGRDSLNSIEDSIYQYHKQLQEHLTKFNKLIKY